MSSSEDSEKTCKDWGFFQQATQVTGMCLDVDTLYHLMGEKICIHITKVSVNLKHLLMFY